MKAHVKKTIAILTLLAIVIPLGGCNWFKKEEHQDDTPVTLVYWGLWEPESVMKDVIETYQQLHPNVTIEYTRRPFSEGVYKDQLLERLADADPQKAPDIMRINNTWLPQFVDELAPLPTDVMSESAYSQTFYETALRDFKTADGIYAIPLEIDTLGLFYNKKLFQNEGLTIPPADWDSFIEYAKKLTKYDSNEKITQAGAAIGTSQNILHSAEILSLLMLQSNITMTNDDHSEAIFDYSGGAQGEVVVDYYTDFVNRYNVWSPELPNSLDMFIQGKLGMMIAPSWRVFDILDQQPNFEFDTAEVPQISLGREVNYSTYWGNAVSKDSKNTKAAWEFLKFLSEQDQLKTMYDKSSELRAFGEPYPRKDMRDDIKNAPYVGPFVKMAPTAKSWYMGDDAIAQEALDNMITEVLTGKSTENAIETATKTVTKELQKLTSQ